MLKFAAGFILCYHMTKPKNLLKFEAFTQKLIDKLEAKHAAQQAAEASAKE